MSIGSIMIGLQASRTDGCGVTSAEFLAPLDIRPGQVEAARADGGAWASGMVYFAVIRYTDFDHVDKSADAGAQSEAIVAAITEAFLTAARFLDQRRPTVTAAMRAAGLSLQIFIKVRMDQDQMDLTLPPELMEA